MKYKADVALSRRSTDGEEAADFDDDLIVYIVENILVRNDKTLVVHICLNCDVVKKLILGSPDEILMKGEKTRVGAVQLTEF